MSLRTNGRPVISQEGYCCLPHELKLPAVGKGGPVLPWTHNQWNSARLFL